EGENAMRNWRQAISDVNDAARFMIREGIADPDSMTILGWSYGGYSALQGGVMDPDLYRAIVAIAPVTDLPKLRDDYRWTTAYRAASRQIGGGANAAEGSPARRAKEIDAPVMIFFGDRDINVSVRQGRMMHDALKDAGKSVDYIEYKGLEHGLRQSKARADMLEKIGRFLNANVAASPAPTVARAAATANASGN
ncbi:MAG: prolyl oligopeptidase family serine peptidase, partial [Pseudomonadota bacterium]